MEGETLRAAKLELGPVQTLAHQDASGNYSREQGIRRKDGGEITVGMVWPAVGDVRPYPLFW